MATPNIEKLSYAEIVDLQSRVREMIEKRKAEKKDKEREMAAELAARAGFSLEDVIGSGRGKRKAAKVALKYRNPKDPSQAWTGREVNQRGWLLSWTKARI